MAKTKAKRGDKIKCWKCTRPDGTDFHAGTVNYAAALAKGVAVEIDAAPANGQVCGHGIHVSPTARQTIQFSQRSLRPWRWFEGFVYVSDIVERDNQKMRVRSFTPEKEIFLADIFGADLAERVAATKLAIADWKKIPWLKPSGKVTDDQLKELVQAWRLAIKPWLAKGKKLPTKVRIIRDRAAAAAAADDDFCRYRYLRWYARPYYVLRRSAWWQIAGMPDKNPWLPLIEIYKLGCIPIGFSKGEFCVYVPKIKKGK